MTIWSVLLLVSMVGLLAGGLVIAGKILLMLEAMHAALERIARAVEQARNGVRPLEARRG
jgi:hypothetical protein